MLVPRRSLGWRTTRTGRVSTHLFGSIGKPREARSLASVPMLPQIRRSSTGCAAATAGRSSPDGPRVEPSRPASAACACELAADTEFAPLLLDPIAASSAAVSGMPARPGLSAGCGAASLLVVAAASLCCAAKWTGRSICTSGVAHSSTSALVMRRALVRADERGCRHPLARVCLHRSWPPSMADCTPGRRR